MQPKDIIQNEFIRNTRVISFDVGFTLLYPFPSVGETYAAIASRFGHFTDAHEVQERFKTAWKQMKAAQFKHNPKNTEANEKESYQWWGKIFSLSMGESIEPNLLEQMFEHCYNEFAKGNYWKLYPDVINSLETLRKRGYRLVILSNWDKRLLQTLNELQLDTYLERIYISTLIGAAKPDPSAFQYMIKDLKVAPAEILHIGDSPEEDVAGALEAGIRPLCIDRNGKCADRNSAFPIISSLSQLTV